MIRGNFVRLTSSRPNHTGSERPFPIPNSAYVIGGRVSLHGVEVAWTERRKVRALVEGRPELLFYDRPVRANVVLAPEAGWMWYAGNRGCGPRLLKELWPDETVRPYHSDLALPLAIAVQRLTANYDVIRFEVSGVSLKGIPNATVRGGRANTATLGALAGRDGAVLESMTLQPVEGDIEQFSLSSNGRVALTLRRNIGWADAFVELFTHLTRAGVLDG